MFRLPFVYYITKFVSKITQHGKFNEKNNGQSGNL